MRRLIIVSGISGAGKSYMLEQLRGRSEEFVPIKKLSTRVARNYEKDQDSTDIRYGASRKDISICEYKYNYVRNIYGVKKKDINRVLSDGKSPLVIIRSSETIKEIKEDYPNALVIYIKSAYNGTDLAEVLKKQGRMDIDIKERMERHRDDLLEYTRNIGLYNYVLTNLYDDDSLISQFDKIARIERQKHQIEQDLFFVLMSFNPDLNHIFDEIEDAARLANKEIRVVRIDKKPGDYPITKEILNHIEKAKLIICDLTEEKPNVYYELGYARGKSKKVIHCAKEGTNLHFDVKDFHTVFYKNSTDLRKKLIKEFDLSFNHEYS